MAKRLLILLAASSLLAGCASLAPRQLAQDRMNDACKSKIASTPLLPLLSSQSKINGYCSCASDKLVSGLSNSELLEVSAKGKDVLADPAWQGRLLNVGLQCLNTLVR